MIGIFAREEEDEGKCRHFPDDIRAVFHTKKTAKGDTSAAKFIKGISGEGDSPDDVEISICIPSAIWSSAVWRGSP